MSTPLLEEWKSTATPIVGMLHAPPLPGAPACHMGLHAIREYVLRDADVLVAGGVHGLMLENFGDVPFFPGHVPAFVVAQMTALASAVRQRFDMPLGINVLRNDGCSALGIAHAVGAAYIRVNVLCSARLTDQGLIQGIAHELLRDRVLLRAEHVRILADVDVKHSTPLGPPRPLEEEIADTIERGGADAIIISGTGTSRPTDVEQVRRAKAASGDVPVLVGSGVDPENVADLVSLADGLIIGSAFRGDGCATNPVDPARVAALMHVIG